MKLFKEAEIKKMLNMVSAEQMSFSRMVELMNEKATHEIFKDRSLKSGITLSDKVNVLEDILVKMPDLTHSASFAIKELINTINNKIVNHCIDIQNSYK